jgi:hypothetical protein
MKNLVQTHQRKYFWLTKVKIKFSTADGILETAQL